MDSRDPVETPEQPDGEGGAGPQAPVGFWRRIWGGGEAPGGEAPGGEAGGPPPAAEEDVGPARGVPTRPRKPRKTIFDKAEDEQRRRHSNAAMVRRERLARAIGDRVEKVILDRMETGEEKLATVAGGFQEVRGLLGAIGRNLDDQGERTARVAGILEQLPAASEREQQLLVQIAGALEEQCDAAQAMAETVQDVPRFLALARQGQEQAGQRLMVLHEVKQELELARTQGARLLEALEVASQRQEERLSRLEECLQAGNTQARHDAEALRRSLELQARSQREQAAEEARRTRELAAEEARREQQRAERVQEAFQSLSRRLEEGNALTDASLSRQQESASAFQDAHAEMLQAMERAQGRHLGELRRLHAEAQDRAEALAWRNRLTLVGCAGVLVVLGLFLFQRGGGATPPAPTQQAQVQREPGGAGTVPAGFKK